MDEDRKEGIRKGIGEHMKMNLHSAGKMGWICGTESREHGDVIAEGISTLDSDSPGARVWTRQRC
jgi:hypothetical protein